MSDLFDLLHDVTAELGTLALTGCEHSPAHLEDGCEWTCRGCELLGKAWAVSDHEAHVAAAVREYIHAVGTLLRDALESAGLRDEAPWSEIRTVTLDFWNHFHGDDE